jgi:O-acetyl-ADP-ribose deacetylase (regulator of RNase III)
MANPDSITYATITIECVQGNITEQADMDAVVNAANAELMPGGGVAGAIHAAAGPGLATECQPLAPIRVGQAVITGAHNLPNKHVIHCLGPVYGVDHPEAKLLASCYRSALNLAETYGLQSIAFPAISTGVFGYPLQEAAEISLSAVRAFNSYEHLQRIRFVLWSEKELMVFKQMLHRVFA